MRWTLIFQLHTEHGDYAVAIRADRISRAVRAEDSYQLLCKNRLLPGIRSSLLYIAWDFKEAWSRMLGCEHTLANLDKISRINEVPTPIADNVHKIFQVWIDSARHKIELLERKFPDIALELQSRLVSRMMVTAQKTDIEQ